MKPADTLRLLEEFFREKLACRRQHEAMARDVPKYEVNNTYQYVIAREDVQLEWLARAIMEMGGAPPAGAAGSPSGPEGRGASGGLQAILERDAADMRAFYERWQPRVEALTHARHRILLRVILGETLEHLRFFEQALAGRSDLLGPGTGRREATGSVLPTRWVE